MYDSMTEVEPANSTENIQISLGGKVNRIRVGVRLPFKKTAAFVSPVESTANLKS